MGPDDSPWLSTVDGKRLTRDRESHSTLGANGNQTASFKQVDHPFWWRPSNGRLGKKDDSGMAGGGGVRMFRFGLERDALGAGGK